MKKAYEVLVFPGGTEIGLEIQSALRALKEVRLHSAGMDVSSHAPHVFARHNIVPGVHEEGWLERLEEVIRAEGIDYVFPAHDDVVLELARHADELSARVVGSPLETCEVARSKARTYAHLRGAVPVPDVFAEPEAIERFPVFAKPDRGQGSEGARAIASPAQLAAVLETGGDLLLMEHLPGEEFTVDCFTDREAGLLFVGGRRRIRTRAGISMHSAPARDEAFALYANAISERLELHGAWFFQVKRDVEGVLKLLEVAPRIAGTSTLYRARGVNFPMLSLYEQERVPVRIFANDVPGEVDRALVNRFRTDLAYGAVYVDLDDTLVVRGEVNTELVAFLYQCINRAIRLVLITKHALDVDETLEKHRLAGLFDEIVHIGPEAEKADYIREADAILIDDSFSERRGVAERLGIPTFDGSMVEALIDHRK